MLINLRNALMAGKRLPYDAEVEYLESTRTQYIDTGVSDVTSSSSLNAVFQYTQLGSSICAFGQNYGFRGNLVQMYTSSRLEFYGTGNATVLTSSGIQDKHEIQVTTNGVVFDGINIAATTLSSEPSVSMCLFSANNGVKKSSCRIYYFRLETGTRNIDLIPVRVGQVGYLYDRVSGKLFGNAGTGDFVLGPDVVPVEWLQSSGTQWIDTGVVPAANDTYTVETRKNNASQDNASFGLAGCVYCFSNGFAGTGYGTFWGHPAVGLGGTAEVNPLGDTNWHTIVASPTSVSIDGVALGYRTSDAQSPLSTVKIFARGNNSASGGVAKQYNGMISRVFVNRGGSDLRKFYAVRVGTDATSWEGAMMDVLTRRIYRNDGTGAFGYGNGLKYPIPAS